MPTGFNNLKNLKELYMDENEIEELIFFNGMYAISHQRVHVDTHNSYVYVITQNLFMQVTN